MSRRREGIRKFVSKILPRRACKERWRTEAEEKGLPGLPVEIWLHIIESSSLLILDLKNLRCTSNTFRHIVTPVLFGVVIIRLNSCSLKSFVNLSESMAHLVRKVRVVTWKSPGDIIRQAAWEVDCSRHEGKFYPLGFFQALRRLTNVVSIEIGPTVGPHARQPPPNGHSSILRDRTIEHILQRLMHTTSPRHLELHGLNALRWDIPVDRLEYFSSMTTLKVVCSMQHHQRLAFTLDSMSAPLVAQVWRHASNLRWISIAAKERSENGTFLIYYLSGEFWRAAFPHLRELHLDQVILQPLAMSPFFKKHAVSLKVLRLTNVKIRSRGLGQLVSVLHRSFTMPLQDFTLSGCVDVDGPRFWDFSIVAIPCVCESASDLAETRYFCVNRALATFRTRLELDKISASFSQCLRSLLTDKPISMSLRSLNRTHRFRNWSNLSWDTMHEAAAAMAQAGQSYKRYSSVGPQ